MWILKTATVYPDPLLMAAHREASLLHLPKVFRCESLTPMSLADVDIDIDIELSLSINPN